MDTSCLLSAIEKLKNIWYEDFKDMLNTMSNEDFASFVTYFYEFNGTNEYQILPIGFNKNNTLLWVGYFAEDYGKANNDLSKKIIEKILQNACNSDYVVINGDDVDNMIFLKENQLKTFCSDCGLIEEIYNEKTSWSDPMFDTYGNMQNDLFVTLINNSNYF